MGENPISLPCLLEVPLGQGAPQVRSFSDALSKSRDSGSLNSFSGGTEPTAKNGLPKEGNDIPDHGSVGCNTSGQPILTSGIQNNQNGGKTIKNRSQDSIKRSSKTGSDSLGNLKNGSIVYKTPMVGSRSLEMAKGASNSRAHTSSSFNAPSLCHATSSSSLSPIPLGFSSLPSVNKASLIGPHPSGMVKGAYNPEMFLSPSSNVPSLGQATSSSSSSSFSLISSCSPTSTSKVPVKTSSSTVRKEDIPKARKPTLDFVHIPAGGLGMNNISQVLPVTPDIVRDNILQHHQDVNVQHPAVGSNDQAEFRSDHVDPDEGELNELNTIT